MKLHSDSDSIPAACVSFTLPPNLPPVPFQSMRMKEQKANPHLGFASSALVNSEQWSRSHNQKEQMCAWPLKRTAEPHICTGRRIYISLHLCLCDWRVVACAYAAVIALSRVHTSSKAQQCSPSALNCTHCICNSNLNSPIQCSYALFLINSEVFNFLISKRCVIITVWLSPRISSQAGAK